MKKTIVLLMMLALLLLALPAMAEQAPEWAFDPYEAEGTLAKYNGPGGDVVIPAEIDGQPVRIISTRTFNANNTITSLVIPEGVTIIQSNAFVGCDALASITLPQSLRVIGVGAFAWNDKLSELTIPAGVGYIGSSALGSSLKRITFEGVLPYMPADTFAYFGKSYGQEAIYVPDDQLGAFSEYFSGNELLVGSGRNAALVSYAAPESDFGFDASTGTITDYYGASPVLAIPETIGGVQVTAIGESVFERRGDIYVFKLPEGLTTIGKRAFAVNQSYISVAFPQTLTSIGEEAFDTVYFLNELNLPKSLQTIGAGAFKVLQFYGYATPLTLPEGLVEIGDEAFYRASFGDLTLPSTLSRIGARAFADCGIAYMALNRYEMPDIAPDAFAGRALETLADIDLPWDATRAQWEAAKAVFEPMGFQNLTIWRNNPTSGGHCFNISFNNNSTKGEYDRNGYLSAYTGTEPNLSVYTSITWDKTEIVNTIGVGEGVFKGSQVIRTFWPHHLDTFTTIQAEAFADSTLEYIEMYDSITTVGARAFAGCTGLTEMYLPPFLTAFAPDALAGCTGITKVKADCDATILTGSMLADCKNLTEISFAKGAIPAGIVKDFAALGSVALGEGVTAIGSEAFAGTSIAQIALPATVTSIASGAFKNCQNLTELTLPASLTEISADAFAGCTGITRIDVRCDASILTGGMFADCKNLSEVSFAKGAIPEGMLENCASLTKITLGDQVTEVGARAFANTNLPGFVIPASKKIDYSAFAGVANLCLSADATDAQLAAWSEALSYPWYSGILREGETPKFVKMPFEATAAENFQFEPETGTIRKYLGDAIDVVIPRKIGGVTVREIAYGAFDRCEDYTNTEVENNVTEWVHLRSVVLPETIEVIGDSLFSYCQQLETFICYAPLESTGKGVFTHCASLNNVVFVNGLREIDNYCFVEVGPMNNLYFGNQLNRVGIQAFSACGMTKLILDAVTFESGAITACEQLTELHIGSRAQKFGDITVQDCPQLTLVCLEMEHAEGKIPGAMMLARLGETVTIRLPEGATEADIRAAEYAPLFGSDMAVNIVCEACPQEPAAMPDAEALLHNAIGAPMTEPTLAPKPTAPSASPAVDASAYLGEWHAISMTMDGETYNIAEMGGEMSVTLNADGSAAMNENGDITNASWTATETGVHIDGMTGTMDEDGLLRLEESGMVMTLSREKPVVSGPSAEDLITYADYLGEWICIALVEGGESLDPLEYDMIIKLSVNEDGTALMDASGSIDRALWRGADNGISVMGQFVSLQEDGTLKIEEDGGSMIFAREGALPAQPEPTQEPDPAPAPAATQTIPPEARMDIRYVCTEAMFEGGVRLPAATLGNEYSMEFHADGTLRFVMAGTPLEGLPWTQRTEKTENGEAEAFVIDYYGMEIIAVLTETGFDMNYMDAMRLFFEPVAP